MARNPAAIDMFIIGKTKSSFLPFSFWSRHIKLVKTCLLLDQLVILYLYFLERVGS